MQDILTKYKRPELEVQLRYCNVTTLPEYEVFKHGGPKEVYFRLLMPALIPEHQALYMDGDTMVNQDLSPLLDTELTPNQWLLGVRQMVCMADYAGILAKEGKPREYISSGICLVNLDWARSINYIDKAVELYRSSLYYISSLVNYLGYDGIVYIPVKYHVGKELINPEWRRRVTAFYPIEEVNEAIECPAIIHYSGEFKPDSGKTNYYIDVWKGYRNKIFGLN